MIDYSQVIKAWRVYRKNLSWVNKNCPSLKDSCLDFISWVKKQYGRHRQIKFNQ